MTAVAVEVGARAVDAGLDRSIIELVNIRVSQLNRCAFCLDLHTRRALTGGESTRRLAVLPAWREVTVFGDRERAALELAEAVTLSSQEHLDDRTYAAVRSHLTDDQVSVLTWAAIAINAFNRVSIASLHQIRPSPKPS
ncbi:carboxymuconolactone decarboxylase family protein [Rhodococcus sp. NPDC127528]|uniref:carboxymuconolactone decarboxylase family protein n=1 Tax=unclassified Rhodococcus (in: high G+C Gram-positive bacteria) TaxID=192944 RepID=UPI00362EB7EC